MTKHRSSWRLGLTLAALFGACAAPDREWDGNTFPDQPSAGAGTNSNGGDGGNPSGGASANGGTSAGTSGAGGDGASGNEGGSGGDGAGTGGVSGDPNCPAGFTGARCDQCLPEHFGGGCEPCACANGTCSDGLAGDGSCSCDVGFDGAACDACDPGHFGAACAPCDCAEGVCDDGIDGAGTCSCEPGWAPPTCSECAAGHYGPECRACECDQGSCNDGLDGTGACTCEAGWAQPSCATCSPNFFGANCTACDCGGGTCNDGLEGDGTCSSCPPGFIGAACNQCQSNRFGPSCTLCNCGHGTCSDGITGTGVCSCDTGWTGPSCNTCASGFFGPQCDPCPSSPTIGCPCTGTAPRCAGTAQKVQLVCTSGRWASGQICGSGQNCNSVDGTCDPIIPECNGRTGGFPYCEAPDIRHTCGPDLVTAPGMTCDGVCTSGVCRLPTCGDSKVQAALEEECDDGNQQAGDSCEPDCKRSRIVKLALGSFHTCALTARGDVRCWGSNANNQLGLGDTTTRSNLHPYQVPLIDMGGPVQDIVAGSEHTCALLRNGTVRCWGRNNAGQLGLGDATPRVTQSPNTLGAIQLDAAAGVTAVQIAAGGNLTCARLSTGAVRCWGNNGTGALGLGNTTAVSTLQVPRLYGPITLGGNAASIAVGGSHVCALLPGNVIRCWGANTNGQLGRQHNLRIGDTELPNATDPNVPAGFDATGAVPIPAGKTAQSIFAGGEHSCVTFTDGTLQCWGANNGGQLGLGDTNHRADAPMESPAVFGRVDLGGAAANRLGLGSASTCALLAGVGLKCWGLNATAELGLPDIMMRGNLLNNRPPQLTALAFGTGLTATDVFVGPSHTCALLGNGRVRCWGFNSQGQVGLASVSMTPDYLGGDPALTPDRLASPLLFSATQ